MLRNWFLYEGQAKYFNKEHKKYFKTLINTYSLVFLIILNIDCTKDQCMQCTTLDYYEGFFLHSVDVRLFSHSLHVFSFEKRRFELFKVGWAPINKYVVIMLNVTRNIVLRVISKNVGSRNKFLSLLCYIIHNSFLAYPHGGLSLSLAETWC